MDGKRFYQYGPRAEQTKQDVSLGAFVIEKLKCHGDRVAQVQEVDGVEVQQTFTDILRRARGVAQLLQKKGVVAGDAVMFAYGNILEYAPVMVGTLILGASCCPVIPTHECEEFVHLLGVCGPRVVFCDPESLLTMTEAVKKLQSNLPPLVISLEETVRCFTDLDDCPEMQAAPIGDPDDHVALIMTSSGTTGRPKGVEIPQSVLYNLVIRQSVPRTLVALCPFAAYWATGMSANFVAMCSGAKLILLKTFTPELFCEVVQKYRVVFACIGVQYLMTLIKLPNITSYDLSSLKMVGCSGTKATAAQLEQGKSKLGTQITPTYGMTEALRMLRPAFNRDDKPGTVGTPDTNFILKVVDLETGETVGANRLGEVCFTGPSVMKGYRGNPEATRLLFDEENFVKSGDIGYFDDDGYFFIVDRIKDHIKYKMTQLPCIDIESVIMEHLLVEEAAVVGIPHDEDTERSTAFVVPKEGATLTADEISNLVKDKLSEMKWLHGGVFFVEKLPRTQSGKVKKHILRSQTTI